MLCTLTCQLVFPAVSSALTSGPSQPEVQSFEPVGTTDMVDMFTGDFVYNIPLMDVEGYPINISYHGGGDMEQEASWVGLGWNINPGVINRTPRGMPDDFNGDSIKKTLNIKPEKNIRVGLGGGIELLGVGTPLINISADLKLSLNISNYRGVSADMALAAGVNIAGMASAGINLGVNSQNGADIDYNLGLSFSTSAIISSDIAVGVGVNFGSGYSTRSGLKDKTFSANVGVTYKGSGIGTGTQATVPIGVKNIIPVVTNSSVMKMYRGQIKLGGELFWAYPHGAVFGMVSTLKYDKDGSRKGYGYLYAQNADDAAIMDFTRDRDGMFNSTMHYLPLGNMTYDIYSVSGQGTGGSFRPFRNDFGSVHDPAVSSTGFEGGVNVEAGLGYLFEVGADITVSNTDITSGPWHDYERPFTNKTAGNIYENTYFKQAGEATAVNPGLFDAIQGINPIKGTQTTGIPDKKPGSTMQRDPRGNLVSYFTGDEASQPGVATSQQLYSYISTNGFAGGPDAPKTAIPRVGDNRKGYHISEVVQTQTDGRRYVYGLPAMNNIQDEVTFAVDPSGDPSGIATYYPNDPTINNDNGRDHYYSKTSTPAFAHSYLLTSVLSTDYVDIKGDGVTDDDFGSFTKFNYTLKDAAYGWKAPYGDMKAQYDPGFKSDGQDDKASYLSGTREQWLTHSIETKNFVAEFYTSVREDGRGVDVNNDLSYKLDSIKLYNKHDRFINQAAAVPIKTVMFGYDYSLCANVPNNVNGKGKLTLKNIYVRYGNSDRSMISPYQFKYGNNFGYNVVNRDRWGGYKESNNGMSNVDFPFVDQNDPDLDKYASAWSLETITLPSGGNINIQYEADDYAYVQDRAAMEMFKLKGLGNSTNYSTSSQLYLDKNTPCRYFYFDRRLSSEKAGLSFQDNYLKGQKILYYNFDTRLVDNKYEPIKGYAEVEEVGACPDGTHGYIKTKAVPLKGGGANLNHVTYTALNFARYYLPHIIFPGSDPDASGLSNILSGIQYAFSELVSFAKNPVKRMVEEQKAKEVRLASSFMRLNSPGLKKKGGGQRVKQLAFYDNWKALAGGNSQDATYGKDYSYTTEDAGGYGTISSGVASYEPQIGGDENPLREPVNYSVQAGSKFPPNDPVGVYQELPLGESLYPGAMVGYSRVTIKSIHQQEGRSAQGMDIYDFYTAKDFPIQAMATPLDELDNQTYYEFTEQRRVYEGTQGYTLIFNDMHGKPKRTEHRIIKPSTGQTELVSYQQYIYNTENGKLSNNVPVIEYDPVAGKMKKVQKQVGYEADLTIDTREKKEHTSSTTGYINFNFFTIAIIPFPMFFAYGADFDFKNEFRSVVATKVVQQYGILKEVQSSQEGALTTVRNEAFDPVTGQALITSVNNEFKDKEYSVNYPAYWGYKSMGPSYQNTGYEENFPLVPVINHAAIIPVNAMANYKVGDEVYMTYNGGATNAWVTSMYIESPSSTVTPFKCTAPWCLGLSAANLHIVDTIDLSNLNSTVQLSIFIPNSCIDNLFLRNDCGNQRLILKPRYKSAFPQTGTLTDVRLKIVRSGAKNQLNESIQSYTGMSVPFDNNGYLKDNLDNLINISAREYSDTLTAILPKYDSLQNPASWDSLNVYVNGTRQIKRVSKEYAYIKNRDYPGNSQRNAGLFSAKTLWQIGTYTDGCIFNGYKYCAIDTSVIPNGIPYPGGAYGNPTPNFYADLTQNRLYILKMPDLSPPNYSMEYNHLVPHPIDDRNWVVARSVTKYSPWGFEIENKDAIGNYTAAMYGYNNQLPVALAQDAKQHEMFSDGFEDFQLLQLMANFARMSCSPFGNMFPLASLPSSTVYGKFAIPGSGAITINGSNAHTGKYALATTGSPTMPLNISAEPVTAGQPRYLPFSMQYNKQYIVSYWFKPKAISGIITTYSAPSGFQLKSNIIEGWQLAEAVITVPATGSIYDLQLPKDAYVDDIRVLPIDANMKAFVYHPVNQKLIATLDENNFASFYEYDQEGNLIRTKKETEKGIITVMESRSANVKKSN
ncbi:MAG: hypothetical protein WC756_06685 [Taibaiella sp.]